MKRGGPLKRKKRLRQRNPERAKRRREDQFGPQARLARLMLCAVPTCPRTPCEPAHVLSRGAGGKDRDVAPLCRWHHREQHQVGMQTFQARHNVDLTLVADELAERVADLLRRHDCLDWPEFVRGGSVRCAVCLRGDLDVREVRL